MRSKTSIKAKRCAHCDRTFTKEEHLKRHERSHTGERPFKCQKCHKRYARSDVLARHLQTHPDESVDVWPRMRVVGGCPMEDSSALTDVDGQRGKTNQTTRPDRSDKFIPEHQELAHPNGDQETIMPVSENHGSHFHQEDLGPPLLLHGTDDCTAGVVPRLARRQSARTPSELERSEALEPGAAQAWYNARHEGTNEASLQDQFLLASLSRASSQGVSMLEHTASVRMAEAMPELHTLQETNSQTSLWQMVHDGAMGMPQLTATRAQEHLCVPKPTHSSLRTSTLPSGDESPLSRQPAGSNRYEASEFTLDMDFGSYNYLSPGMSDILDFAATRTPSLNTRSLSDGKGPSSETLFSVDQVQRMRHLWRGRRIISNVRMIRSIWRDVVQHEADNIFSRPRSCERADPEPVLESPRISRWGIDDGCRERLCTFCRKLDNDSSNGDLANLTPRSTSGVSDSDAGHSSSLVLSLIDGFPTREVLDASFDMFFQRCTLHFIQKATFDARTVPDSLLLAIHLVGLSSLYPERSRAFVLQYQKKLIHFCRTDLTSKVPGHCQPWEILTTMACTLLMVYVGLEYLEQFDEGQSHTLCIQMLHIAEKYGLFAASDGEDPNSQLQEAATGRDKSWTAWCRVESIKRMICCCLWMDMAYARIMGGAGVLDIEKVELHLPCDVALFEAATSNRFLQIARDKARMTMPPISVQNFHTDLSPTLNHMAMETLLVALYLRIAAIRRRTSTGYQQPYLAWSSISDEEFTADHKTDGVVASLLSLPPRSADLFQQRHRVTAFAWNNVCIAVTADLNLLEIASGRDGIDAARTAMTAVCNWSRTARARRATLHATQIFDILSSSRLSEWNIARPDLLLYQSGLVLSMYLFVCDYQDVDQDGPAFELLQSIDWVAMGPEGLPNSTQPLSPSPSLSGQSSSDAAESARNFIRHGGPVSFSGDVLGGGSMTARKVLLNYVHLLDEIGKYRGSSYSQILKTMSDFVIEGNH